MQRLPLTDSRIAAALMAIGVDQRAFHIEPLHNTGTGEKKTSWYVQSAELADIRQLLSEADHDNKNALWRTDANHPFIAALAGIENHEMLTRWLRGNFDLPGTARAAPGSQVLKVALAGDEPFPVEQPAVGIASVPHAAAMIAAGFVVYPVIQDGGIFGFQKESLTFPGLTADMCMDAANVAADRSAFEPPELPGFPRGRHPFLYALSACLNLRLIAPSEASAWKVPTHFFPGRGTRCALANDAALKRRGFTDSLQGHLAGV